MAIRNIWTEIESGASSLTDAEPIAESAASALARASAIGIRLVPATAAGASEDAAIAALFDWWLILILSIVLLGAWVVYKVKQILFALVDALPLPFGKSQVKSAVGLLFDHFAPGYADIGLQLDRKITAWVTAFATLVVHFVLKAGFITAVTTTTVVRYSFAPVANIVHNIDVLTQDISKLVTTGVAHFQAQAHALWTRIATVEQWTIDIQKAVQKLTHIALDTANRVIQLTTTVTRLNNQIAAANHAIKILQSEEATLRYLVHTLTVEIKKIETRVGEDERIFAPGIEAAAIMTLLAPLIEAGPAGIENLAREAKDPCSCFTIPGTMGFWLTAAVTYLMYEKG